MFTLCISMASVSGEGRFYLPVGLVPTVSGLYVCCSCLRRRSFLLACWFSADSVWFVCVLFMSPGQVIFP